MADPVPIDRPSRRHRVLLGAVVAVALALRLAVAVQRGDDPLVADPVNFDNIAWNLAGGHGYQLGTTEADRAPTATRAPGYVLFLAALYGLLGHSSFVVYVAQALLEAVTCLIVYRLGRQVFRRRDVALVGALLLAVHPAFVVQAGTLAAETLTFTTFTLSLAAFLAWVEGRRGRLLALSAVGFAVTALIRPNLAPLPVLFALAALPAVGGRAALRAAAVHVGVMAVVFAPWVVRNAVVFHAFVPTVTSGGWTFWGGTGPAGGRTVGSLNEPHAPPHVVRAVEGLSEVERDRWLYREGMRVVREDPARFAGLVARKTLRLWFNLGYSRQPSAASLALAFASLLAWLLALAGIRALAPQRTAVHALAVMVVFFTLTHALFFAVFRYAMPVYAFLMPFTAAGLVAAARRRELTVPARSAA